MKKLVTTMAFALAVSTAFLPQANAQTQGVTDTEILVGSNNDLSGVFAAFGAPAIGAAKQYFDQVNAAGGVHGRQIKLISEDHGYQMPKAMQNLNKLVNSDGIFVMFQQLGTPMNMASFPLLERKKIVNYAPLSASRQMIEPPSPYKFTSFSSYYDQVIAAAEHLKDNEGTEVLCTMYLPNDYGKEVQVGTKDAAEKFGLKYAAETTHKGDEQDFVGALTKLKEEGCDTIALGVTVRQAITVLGTAKKIGWDAKFFGVAPAFHTVVAKVPGGITEGFFAASGWPDMVSRLEDPYVQKWIEEYKAEFGEEPSTGSMLGRSAAEGLVMALEAAGPDLTAESFLKAMESLDYTDKLTGVKTDYGPDDHQGGDTIIISKIKSGDWQVIAEK